MGGIWGYPQIPMTDPPTKSLMVSRIFSKHPHALSHLYLYNQVYHQKTWSKKNKNYQKCLYHHHVIGHENFKDTNKHHIYKPFLFYMANPPTAQPTHHPNPSPTKSPPCLRVDPEHYEVAVLDLAKTTPRRKTHRRQDSHGMERYGMFTTNEWLVGFLWFSCREIYGMYIYIYIIYIPYMDPDGQQGVVFATVLGCPVGSWDQWLGSRGYNLLINGVYWG